MSDVTVGEPRTSLLVWDAPNMDMTLASILGHRPNAQTRPHFDAVGRWLVRRARERDAVAEATMFINVAAESAGLMAPFVQAVRNLGFAVFARPKVDGRGDIDDDIIDHVRRRADGLVDLVVASHDGRAFAGMLEEIAAGGGGASVLGFSEYATWVEALEGVALVDIDDVPGCFDPPLDRVTLDRLPVGGAWLRPLQSLERLFDEQPAERLK